MKIILIVVYASLLPDGGKPEMKVHPQTTMKECNDTASFMMKRANAGKILAFCWRIKDDRKH